MAAASQDPEPADISAPASSRLVEIYRRGVSGKLLLLGYHQRYHLLNTHAQMHSVYDNFNSSLALKIPLPTLT